MKTVQLFLNGKEILSEEFGEVDRFYRSKFLARASLYSFKGDLLKIRELLDDIKSQLTHYNKNSKIQSKKGEDVIELKWCESTCMT